MTMDAEFELMVAGARVAGEQRVSSPWDLSDVGIVPTINSDGAEIALQTAQGVFRDKSRWLKPEQRIKVLETTAEIMTEQFEELALLAASEGGKPLLDSRVEVARAIDGVRNSVECLRGDSGREIPMNLNAASANRLAFTRREP
ncbi:MAG: acyl-CoA reductase-like NAD-dependent aldehyde dehydrogenase, partial [Gammaproteobacteria bacterium]